MSVALSSAHVRYLLYKHISYEHVAARIAGPATDPADAMSRLTMFVHDNLTAGGGEVIDDQSWDTLVRGIGWCDQQAAAAANLLAMRGIEGRMVMLVPRSGPSNHTVLEARVDGRWVVLDPLTGMVFSHADGRLATIAEIHADQRLFFEHPRYLSVGARQRDDLATLYEGILQTPDRAVRWPSPLVDNASTWRRWFADKAVKSIYTIFGGTFAGAYQDLDFWLEGSRNDAADLYARARGYQLYGRTEAAVVLFRRLTEEHARTVEGRRAWYFLGRLLLDEHPAEAADALQRYLALSQGTEDPTWRAGGQYYLGTAYARLGRHGLAREQIRPVVTDGVLDVIPLTQSNEGRK